MGRLGVNFNEASEFIKKVSKIKNIIIDGIYTHFATSDESNKEFAKIQLERFNRVINILKSSNTNYGLAHTSNSGAILDMPDSYFDMVRPGIALYGYYPSNQTSESIKLKPVMSLLSAVSDLRQIRKGDSVSYGRTYLAKKDTKIISVPIGYADGFNRNLSNKVRVLIKNKFYPQVGTITMDRVMFDIGNDKIKIGDIVTLIGEENKKIISAWDWCKILNTIPYEITCCITKRIPRVYVY
jgi:alanine racemase